MVNTKGDEDVLKCVILLRGSKAIRLLTPIMSILFHKVFNIYIWFTNNIDLSNDIFHKASLPLHVTVSNIRCWHGITKTAGSVGDKYDSHWSFCPHTIGGCMYPVQTSLDKDRC